MKGSDYIIEFNHITKSFGDKCVLDDVNFSVKKGEFVTILGPSGCGKTTLLRLLAGFGKPDDGQIRINGEDYTDVPPHMRPVNTVFQRYALFPYLNVYDNIAFGLKLKKVDEDEITKRVNKALKMVGMLDYEWRDINSLSGGQQQRVAIARAIVNKPKVLLLDEPLAALDLKMRKDMQMELKDMHKTLGITFIYVTHDQEEALTLSDTVVVMREGCVQQIGTPMDIYNEPKNSFVADFIGESNIIDGVMIKDYKVSFMGCEFDCVDKGFGENVPVDVVIRPEDVYIMHPSPSAMFNGVVQSCIFKGVHYEIIVLTDNKYEIMIQDYNPFGVGEQVSMIIKPNDLHVMQKERICNTFEGQMVDSTHVKFLDTKFQCLEMPDVKGGENVVVEIPFDKIELMDNEEDGSLVGDIRFILYKGNHYHLTVRTESGEDVYVNTNEVWDNRDLVSIRILPEDIKIKL